MSQSKYVKPQMEIEKYSPVDVLTASTESGGDLHNTDDYEYGNNN